MAGESGDLKEFQSINPTSSGIRITFKAQGTRFNFKIGDQERRVGVYSESIEVPFGQHAEFASKGLSIIFDPADQNQSQSFKIKKELDFRPIGGSLKIELFTLTAQSGSIVYGPVSTSE